MCRHRYGPADTVAHTASSCFGLAPTVYGTRELLLEDHCTVFLDDTEVQPGRAHLAPRARRPLLTEDDYVEGAPQLVVEVAASSASA